MPTHPMSLDSLKLAFLTLERMKLYMLPLLIAATSLSWIHALRDLTGKNLFAMSSDNASSAVTYISVSSDLNGPSSWGIPLVNTGELLEMDPYEDVSPTTVRHTHLSPDYSEDQPYDEEVFTPTAESSQDTYLTLIRCEEDDDEEPMGNWIIEPSAPTDPSSVHMYVDPTYFRRLRKTVRLEPPMSASMQARIAEHAAVPIPPTSPTYDQAPLGHRGHASGSLLLAKRATIGQYDFIDTVEARTGMISSPGHDAQTIARAADRAKDVGYVHRKESEDFYTQLLDARTNRRDIRLEIDVVRRQRTAYETELHKVRHAYLSSEAQNWALLALLETLIDQSNPKKLTILRMLQAKIGRRDFQKAWCNLQPCLSTLILHEIQNPELQGNRRRCWPVLIALKRWNWYFTLAVVPLTISEIRSRWNKYCPKGEIKKLEIELWNLRVRGNDVAAYTQRFQELALMCTKFLLHDESTGKVDKYISRLSDNIHGNVMSARPKTLDDAIELTNDLMDQKLRTYPERKNENMRKADDSSRNNHQ
ncbi:hypothetical protein Tco_0421237 [Tanacetum coccineum]